MVFNWYGDWYSLVRLVTAGTVWVSLGRWRVNGRAGAERAAMTAVEIGLPTLAMNALSPAAVGMAL